MEDKPAEKKRECKCPYCDAELDVEEMPIFCQPCAVTIVKCGHCGGPVRLGSGTCPECGAKTG